MANQSLDQKTANATLAATDKLYKLSSGNVDQYITGGQLKSQVLLNYYTANRTIFVGKHGNDSNSGTNEKDALLTFEAAITAANLLTPADGSRVNILCNDAGTYSENLLVLAAYTSIIAPSATIKPAGVHNIIQIAEECAVIVYAFIQDQGGSAAVVGANSVGKRFIKAEMIEATGASTAFVNYAVTTTGLCYLDIENIEIDTGKAISDNSSGGETHVDIKDIYINGNGGTAVFNGGSGNIFGLICEIEEKGTPTGTIGLDVDGGKVRLFISELELDTAYDVESGAELFLFVNDMSGTELNDGTANITKAGERVNITANTQTGTTYTLVLTDRGKLVTLDNGSAITLTIPANASVAFTVGTQIDIAQLGAGQVTVEITSDTLNSLGGATKLSGQYSTAVLTKITATSWLLSGDITT